MRIENVLTTESAMEQYKQMDMGELVGQQIALRGAIHAMEFLLKEGATAENAAAVLDNVKQQLFAVHEVAHARGIQLPGYQ